MAAGKSIVVFSTKHPVLVVSAISAVTLLITLGAALPSLWPRAFPLLNALKVDTDPENMLSAAEPVRVFHSRMKKEMALHDMVVVGIVNTVHPDGVFNPHSLRDIYDLTEFARSLRWPDQENPGRQAGVIEADIIAPSTVDNIQQRGPGTVAFEWLMPEPPATRAGALAVREKASRLPLLNGTLVSGDGRAVCIYLPLTSKDQSYRVYTRLQEKIATFSGDDRYHITGLPVANDTFGVEMFIQMAISAPLAMLIIFAAMLAFFRKLSLILSPLILALLGTLCTMGLLVISGNTIHIMSSMIPIFIMPIAVLDSVHILSEFFDRYRFHADRRTAIIEVMGDLFMPMLYTSLTTAVGFASLALAPIPPVQIFGLFVAFGVLAAWLFTITFIPAYIMFIPERSLADFGHGSSEKGPHGFSFLGFLGRLSYRRARTVTVVSLLIAAVSLYGISLITINDNPIKWFSGSHPIRIADRVLNEHFGGTYMAYLALLPEQPAQGVSGFSADLEARMTSASQRLSDDIPEAPAVFALLAAEMRRLSSSAETAEILIDRLNVFASERIGTGTGDSLAAWDEAVLFLDGERRRFETFKQPGMLAYIEKLQRHLSATGAVGKANSIADIVKTVYRELVSGSDSDFVIPPSAAAVGQCLITYQNSHRPHDIWHFVTPDYRKAVLWLQLTSGDNTDMSLVVDAAKRFIRHTPPPVPLRHSWFGLTYINVVWQQKMVRGMLEAFLGSFLIVFLMMTILYRSALWGLLCMIPLTVTIILIYGITGFIGKDYDMPVAVLSSLSLGLAVDYAIHFLSRARTVYAETMSWDAAVGPMFGEPARAISRNVIVLGVGFLPLLLAPLVPYKTVGIFIASILLIAGITTLLLLPSLLAVLERLAFPGTAALQLTCKCGTCVATSTALVALAFINLVQFTAFGWTSLTWIGIAAVLILSGICFTMSRRQSCGVSPPPATPGDSGRTGHAAGPPRQ